LSPYLFNIFVDELLVELNRTSSAVPRSIFYADDGALLASSAEEMQCLLDVVVAWCNRQRMTLNVGKCGYLAPPQSEDVIFLADQAVPRVLEYSYLGFPLTCFGIDFDKHITRRIDQACARTAFLSVHSDRWGPAHRLRVYRQFLAPIMEYGAPLTAAYAERKPQFWAVYEDAINGLVAWISGYDSRIGVTRNVLGLYPLRDRFAALKSGFQVIIRYCPDASPLKTLSGVDCGIRSFYKDFTNDSLFHEFLLSQTDVPILQSGLKRALHTFLRRRQSLILSLDAYRRKLTRLIPFDTRLKHGLRGADRILHAPRLYQKSFLQYRRGTFATSLKCICSSELLFHRRHEACFRLEFGRWLSNKEESARNRAQILLGPGILLTDIDYLLNTGQFDRAYEILQHITRTLAKANSRALS